MNLRPSGYEPDELPGCSTPRFVVAKVAAGPAGARFISAFVDAVFAGADEDEGGEDEGEFEGVRGFAEAVGAEFAERRDAHGNDEEQSRRAEKRPRMRKATPMLSENAAMKPQKPGQKVMPRCFIARPMAFHLTRPPASFGQPWA